MNRQGLAFIRVEFTTTCLTCEEEVEVGENAWWVRGVGCWHVHCDEPRSLAQYLRDQDRGKRHA